MTVGFDNSLVLSDGQKMGIDLERERESFVFSSINRWSVGEGEIVES